MEPLEQTYIAFDGGSLLDEARREWILSRLIVREAIRLKVGIKVMLVKDIDTTFLYGTMGRVSRFVDPMQVMHSPIQSEAVTSYLSFEEWPTVASRRVLDYGRADERDHHCARSIRDRAPEWRSHQNTS